MLVLIGKSGSGKTTIEDIMIHRYNMVRAISHTTRPKRENDVEGVNYFFVSNEEMQRMYEQGELAERIDYIGNVYALCKEQCKTDKVVVVAPEGLKQLLEKDDLDVFSVYLDVTMCVRKSRMLARGDSDEDVEKRIKNDDAIFDGTESKVNLVLENNGDNVDEISEIVWKEYNRYMEES